MALPPMAHGTSFCGSVISSPALLGSSNPTYWNIRTGTSRTAPAIVGLKSPAPKPCTPFLIA